mmetsp:Transcript_65374/g.181819  ORF Transcript_65374/g.181819 Transcript_65374/m.181819 type:complete len:210 (+) Transcript_65374:600-1229(+)
MPTRPIWPRRLSCLGRTDFRRSGLGMLRLLRMRPSLLQLRRNFGNAEPQLLVPAFHGLEPLLRRLSAAILVGVHFPGEATVRCVEFFFMRGFRIEAKVPVVARFAPSFKVSLAQVIRRRALHDTVGDLVHEAPQVEVCHRVQPSLYLVLVCLRHRGDRLLTEDSLCPIIVEDDGSFGAVVPVLGTDDNRLSGVVAFYAMHRLTLRSDGA